MPLVWALADVAMALMTLVNVGAILMLSREVISALRDYEGALNAGRQPVFSAGKLKLADGLADSAWIAELPPVPR